MLYSRVLRRPKRPPYLDIIQAQGLAARQAKYDEEERALTEEGQEIQRGGLELGRESLEQQGLEARDRLAVEREGMEIGASQAKKAQQIQMGGLGLAGGYTGYQVYQGLTAPKLVGTGSTVAGGGTTATVGGVAPSVGAATTTAGGVGGTTAVTGGTTAATTPSIATPAVSPLAYLAPAAAGYIGGEFGKSETGRDVGEFLMGQHGGEAEHGAVTGGLSGAAGGAAVGSMILPGIGTGVGALIGGAFGFAHGAGWF